MKLGRRYTETSAPDLSSSLYIYIHTFVYTNMHTYIQTNIHAFIHHTYKQANVRNFKRCLANTNHWEHTPCEIERPIRLYSCHVLCLTFKIRNVRKQIENDNGNCNQTGERHSIKYSNFTRLHKNISYTYITCQTIYQTTNIQTIYWGHVQRKRWLKNLLIF